VPVPEANATRHRVKKGAPAKGYDRSRIHLDRPKIRIASRDFH
jgi:error-prone DNA polymerase